jgi:hypothetical protein
MDRLSQTQVSERSRIIKLFDSAKIWLTSRDGRTIETVYRVWIQINSTFEEDVEDQSSNCKIQIIYIFYDEHLLKNVWLGGDLKDFLIAIDC